MSIRYKFFISWCFYLKYKDYQKNVKTLSANSVTEFIKVVTDWMHEETMSQLRDCDHVTLLLNEMPDISNQSELSLMARIVKDRVVKNLFLDLLL